MKRVIGDRGVWLWAALAGAAMAAGGGALAQETGASRIDTLMEEITVTARKREESLQEAPLSITAFTGASLEARGVTRLSEIQNLTPNLTFYEYTPFGASANNANVFLRGIGQADFAPTTEPGVGIYVDGVYFGRSVGSVLSLVDLERVEVLRGPQGTLFGRNTIGGAISLTTRKPHEEFDFMGEVTVGEDERLNVKGSVNIPISETLYASIGAVRLYQEGFIHHETEDSLDFGDDDTVTARAALRWVPTSNFEFNFNFDYSMDRENGVPNVPIGGVFIDPAGFPPAGNFIFTHNVLLPFGLVNGQFVAPCGATFADPAGSLANPACYNDQYNGRINGNPDNYFAESDIWGAAGTIEWSPRDWLTLKSITAYRKLDSHFSYDGDFTPLFILEKIEDIFKQQQITQEFQVLGRSFDDRLEWIAGFYFFAEEGINPNPVFFLPITIISGGDFHHDSIAGFAQATYDITDQWRFTAGIRYTDDTKRFQADQFITEDRTGGAFPVGTRTLPYGTTTLEEDDWTPMFNLSYDWNENLMVYASYSEGFKGGGFHQRVFPPLPETPTFEPEFVTTYEGGFKFSTADRRFTLNGAGFYSEYDDLQVTVFTDIAPVLDNAGNATIAGFELDSHWVPLETWLVEGAVGYLDASYDEVDPTTGLLGDEELVRVPEWTASAALIKEFALGDGYGTLTPRVDWSYRSKTWFDIFNTPFMHEDGYHLVNATLAWDSVDGHYGATFGVKNIGDEIYRPNVLFQAGFGNIVEQLTRGREWYLTLRYNY